MSIYDKRETGEDFIFSVPLNAYDDCEFVVTDAYCRLVCKVEPHYILLMDDSSDCVPLRFWNEETAHELALELQCRTGQWFGVDTVG